MKLAADAANRSACKVAASSEPAGDGHQSRQLNWRCVR
jgi:hypothetical protein